MVLKCYVAEVSNKPAALTPAQQKIADVNADGVTDLYDAQFILRYYVSNTLAGRKLTWEQILAAGK